MAPNAKKEAPFPPKVENKAKAVKAKKAVLKGVHRHTKKMCTTSTFQRPQTLQLKEAQISSEESPPRRHRLDHYAIIKVPLTIESAVTKTEDNTLYALWDVKANKQAPDQTGCEALWHWHDQGRHSGQAWWRQGICSTPDYNALDVVNKIEII